MFTFRRPSAVLPWTFCGLMGGEPGYKDLDPGYKDRGRGNKDSNPGYKNWDPGYKDRDPGYKDQDPGYKDLAHVQGGDGPALSEGYQPQGGGGIQGLSPRCRRDPGPDGGPNPTFWHIYDGKIDPTASADSLEGVPGAKTWQIRKNPDFFSRWGGGQC